MSNTYEVVQFRQGWFRPSWYVHSVSFAWSNKIGPFWRKSTAERLAWELSRKIHE